MIKIGSKDVSAIRFGQAVIMAVYKGGKLIWESISSCFGAGYWINNYPWKNTDAWKN